MMTQDDMDDVLVNAEIKAEREIGELMRKLMSPEIERAGVMMWAELPDDARQVIRTNRPELAKYYDDKMKGR